MLADVFNAPVYTIKNTANSACLGCAYRAKHGLMGGDKVSFKEIVRDAPPYHLAVEPNPRTGETYTALTARYKELEDTIVNPSNDGAKRRKTES